MTPRRVAQSILWQQMSGTIWLVLKIKLCTSYVKGYQVRVLYTASCIASLAARSKLLPTYVKPKR